MAKKLNITVTIYRETEEIELDVTASAYAPEPDVGIFSWQIEDICWTPDIELTDKEQEMIEEKLQEAANSYD